MPLLRIAKLIWLASALAASAQAGVVRGPAPVYAPPAGAWAGPLQAAFAEPSLSGLIPLSLSGPSLVAPEAMRAAAPFVTQLAVGLSLSPSKFAALPLAEKKAVFELAAESARDELSQKVYELAEHARVLASPGKALDREARADLYGTVARLMEIREHYGAWLGDNEKAAVEDGYKLASTRAWEVRNALIGDAGAPLGVEESPAPARPAVKLSPGAAARRMRADMETNKNGWGQSDLDTLYTGYGFVLRQGGKHRFYSHPDFPQLHETVSRQNDLPPGYAQSALKLIAELERLTAPQEAAAPAEARPPATLNLADLTVLLSPPAEKIPTPKPVVVESQARAPPAARPAAQAVAVKAAPEAPAPPKVTAQLAPSTPKVAEPKSEPPAVETKTAPRSWLDRTKDYLKRLNKR